MRYWLFLVLLCLVTASCGDGSSVNLWLNDRLDYGQESNWLTLPDNADEYAVDVFYAYPTVYQGDGLADIADEGFIAAAGVPLRTQASVFEGAANIYAPLYRQLGKTGFAGDPDERDALLLVSEQDLEDALLYYLRHYNKGKPFFIAAHSQGTTLLVRLLTKIWGRTGTGGEDRLIAAYLIGYSITQDDLDANTNMRMCRNADDTGCFISYNSVEDGKQASSVQILPGAHVTNPLSWETAMTGGAVVPATANAGAVFFDDDGYNPVLYEQFSSAQIKEGGLVCVFTDSTAFDAAAAAGIYHQYDYAIFYNNLRENIASRKAVFLAP